MIVKLLSSNLSISTSTLLSRIIFNELSLIVSSNSDPLMNLSVDISKSYSESEKANKKSPLKIIPILIAIPPVAGVPF